MSDALRVEYGCAPWLPSRSVQAGEVLDFYNVPRAGLLHDHGNTYFFDCILGDGGPLGVWLYVHVNDDEMTSLLHAHDPESFDAAAEQLIKGRWVTIAAAVDYEIKDDLVVDAGDDDHGRLMGRLVEHWDDVARTSDSMRSLVGSA